MALPDTIRELLEAGVHFGHLSKHWNPKMKRFIFGKKKDVYIIDLEKTAVELEKAKDFVARVAQDGKKVLFVATKKQIRDSVRELAKSCNMPYSGDRWIGGFLTNFATVRPRVKRYVRMLEKKESGDFSDMNRKEMSSFNRELERMDRNYRGVKDMDEIPSCIYVVDPKRETACVREAARVGIPIVAIVDTNADPDKIDLPIPGNDDAIKSVRYITSQLSQAISQGAQRGQDLLAARQAQAKVDEALLEKEPDVAKYEVIEEELVSKVEKEKAEKELAKKRVQQKDK